ncbi:MAG: gliding motility-associated C-terminal domain-containing protein [Ginsengibacter sp.]
MRISHLWSREILLGIIFYPCYFFANAQSCPPNIDFETGTFNGWTCYTGTAEELNGRNIIDLSPSSGPVYNRHTMYTSNSGNQVDPYGGFPVNCPNGSGHSIRLGNSSAGTEAEGISYEFTIPADQDIYSLIYHYAVVFQDPNHEQYQQPRLAIEIMNVTDNKIIECSSFTFIPYGSLLPGFFESPRTGGGTPVWCKDWSAVSVNLDGNAGKTIRLFFKTADCTFRRHFGYAYIDVNSECSSEFVGATYCIDDTAVNLTAPYGYQNYTWYNNDFTKVLGTQQTITFNPPPVSGSIYAVKVVPYDGYGCVDTLHAILVDSLTVNSNAGRDTVSCNKIPVPLGVNSKPGLVYNWSPSEGLSNSKISNPVAAPDHTTTYILTTSHDGGGCVNKDTVVVKASIIDSVLRLSGKPAFCSDSNDSAVLHVKPTQKIQWVVDNLPIYGASQPTYRVSKSGSYYAYLVNEDGCTLNTKTQNIVIDDPRPGINYPVQYAVINLPLDLTARQFGDEVLWTPGISLDNRTTYTPVFSGSAEQLYKIQIQTKGGCITVDTQLVKTVEKVDVFVPNAFTPNSDGLNDLLRPAFFGIKQLNYFRIFNRAGQQLFQTTSFNSGWDGRLKGIPQTSQVVAWILEGVGVDNKTYQRKGTSLLVR